MNYKNNIPFSEKGIPVSQASFSGGRVSADLAQHGGLTHIRYFGKQQLGRSEFFTADPISAWAQLFRLFVEIDGESYYAEFNDTLLYPFGYQSRCDIEGVKITHDLILINDALTVNANVVDGAEGKTIRFKWQVTECAVKKGCAGREWSDFSVDENRNMVTCSVRDECKHENNEEALTQQAGFGYQEPSVAETFMGITADCPLEFYQTPEVFKKTYISSRVECKSVTFTLSFATSESELFAKTMDGIIKQREQVLQNYAEQLEKQTLIESDNPCVNSFLANAVPMIQAMKVDDIRGGYRAADSGYWIWGWDSMVHADALLYAGNTVIVKDLLQFYRETAHPEKGIFHSLSTEGKPMLAMAPVAQCLYGVMLYQYYCFTHDIDVLKEYYEFSKKIVENALSDEVNGSGLVAGVSLYPDYPEHVGQTGNDISSFNNSILYQALRCMSVCAELLNKHDDAKKYAEFAERLKEAFNKYLFDKEKGYYYDSIDSKDFTPRKHYPVYAILDTSPFALELVDDKLEKVAAFMKSNFPQKYGLSMFSRKDSCFMKDGNQLGMYMPVIEGFYRHVMKCVGSNDEAVKFVELIEWAWNQLSVPEALSCEAVNHGLTLDNPGRKQAFCIKAWYSMYVKLVLGNCIDHESDCI